MTVLAILVEDSKTIRDELIPTLEELAGVKVVAVAETAHEAIVALSTHRHSWTVATVDMFLRSGSGMDVVKACRQRGERQRVVVLTNYATPDIRSRCTDLGADAVFDKSTELDAFIEYCANLSDQAS